jgi:hypothetical protein
MSVRETLSDTQRRLLLAWAVTALTSSLKEREPGLFDECLDLVRKLSGTDTRIVVERAYPSTRGGDKQP